MTEQTASEGDVTVTYHESETERILEVAGGEETVTISQNRDGYAMLSVRDGSGVERERYYGFEMAIDHAAELLGVPPTAVPIPDAAEDMGM